MKSHTRTLSAVIGGVLLWASVAGAGEVKIRIPDGKEAAVTAAVAAYNLETGEALTTKQWVRMVLRREVALQLKRKDSAESFERMQAKKAELDALMQAESTAVQKKHADRDEGWK